MQPVQERMIKIVKSLPKEFFQDKSSLKLVQDLGKKYIEIYGYDETTNIPE